MNTEAHFFGIKRYRWTFPTQVCITIAGFFWIVSLNIFFNFYFPYIKFTHKNSLKMYNFSF